MTGYILRTLPFSNTTEKVDAKLSELFKINFIGYTSKPQNQLRIVIFLLSKETL